MSRPICLPCNIMMRPAVNGVVIVTMTVNPPHPYQLWSADRVACPVCGAEVITGQAVKPFAVGDVVKSIYEKLLAEHPDLLVYDYEHPLPAKMALSPDKVADRIDRLNRLYNETVEIQMHKADEP